MRLSKDDKGFVTLFDTVEKKELRVRAGTAVEILSHDQNKNPEEFGLQEPRYIEIAQEKTNEFDRKVQAEVAKQLALHGIRSAENRYAEKNNTGLERPATGDVSPAAGPRDQAQGEGMEDKIAEAVAQIKENASEGDPRLTDKGNPKKEAVEEVLGFPISQKAFLAAIKG